MILSSRHLTVTLVVAMLLHVGVALWLSLPEVTPPVVEKSPLKINLLAVIAETTVNAAAEVVEPPPEKPRPIIQKPPKKPKPVVKPKLPGKPPVKSPEVETKPVETKPEPVIAKETISTPIDAVATARYEQLLIAWLEKHKKYPSRAKRLRIEGEGMLRISIDRSGRTRLVELAQRTGNRLLDKAALAMVERANPFPAMPEKDPREEMEFMVPVAFLLR